MTDISRPCVQRREGEDIKLGDAAWDVLTIANPLAKLPVLEPHTRSKSSQTLSTWANPKSLPELTLQTTEVHSDGECDVVNVVAQDSHQIDESAARNLAPALSAIKISCAQRSKEQDIDEEPPPEHEHKLILTFNPYDQLKSIREVNEAIKAELQRFHPSTEGYIYGFLHPSVLVRIGTGPARETQLIKIGRTVNVERRMKQWKKQCKYEPSVVLAQKMAHHQTIERIVHHQLHNIRFRELHCPGCGFRHNEWFRVNTTYAEHLVSMWQNFAQREPYDQFGVLLPYWSARLEHLDLEDPGCWMWFILGPTSVEPVSREDHSEECFDSGRL